MLGALAAVGLSLAAGVSPATGLSDDQLAGTRIVSGFDGRHPPAELRRMISAGEISGVILFDENVGGRRSVGRLTRELQAIPRPAGAGEPLLICVDQEGGLVKRLPGPPKPSAHDVGERGARFARRLGRATGISLRSMGVNVDFAPVLDVGRRGGAIEDEQRTYSRRPGAVSWIGGGFARGLSAGGVAATGKHFPGLGAARINTDSAVQRIRLPAATIRKVDERPYSSFSAAGGALVMLSTAIYPALSERPAAFAPEVATGELRDRLGFQGVSVTDSLDSTSARAFGGPARTARAAAQAGSDVALFTDLSSAARAQRSLAKGLAAGSLDRAAFEQSVNRILALRASFRSAR